MSVLDHQFSDKLAGLNFQTPPHLCWSIEVNKIMLIDQKSSKNHVMLYPEAAVWQLIHRNYHYGGVVRMISAIVGLNFEDTENFLLECLEKWTQKKIIVQW